MAEAFLKVVLDNLGSLIKEEIGLILGVDEEMQKLSSTFTTLQAVLEDAEDKQIESKPIRDWLQKLNALAYKIDDILDECNTHVSKLKHTRNKLSRYSLQKILYRHKIGRRMKQVTKQLDGVAAERAKFHLLEMPVDRPREVAASRETGSLLNHTNQIYGRKKDKEKIVGILLNDVKENQDMSVLPIIGVGGLGKTTLAQLVFNDPRVVDHFNIRIWVCVSDNFELKTLVKAMIEAATGSAKATDLHQLDVVEHQLSDLLSQKRYLIVLDDVWNDQQEKWFELKDTLSCGSTGASIIVTTRQKKVADIMGTLPPHFLKGLSDENCWMLLRSRAFGHEEEASLQLELIGKQIVKKCAGVPLAAKALGGILRFKRTREEWIYVKESELWKLSPEESLILPALRLSYHHLPLQLRQCFAYFAAFPKDHEIEKEELILRWIAHGHIPSNGNIQGEDVGNQICNELLLRSLLQTSVRNDKFMIIHDLVHDLAQSIMENKVPGIPSDRNILRASTIRECLNLSGKLEIRHLERVKDHLDAKKANMAAKKNLKELSLLWERDDLSKLEEDIDEKVLEALEPHPNLESLQIKGFRGRFLPRWMTYSTLGNVVRINITDCLNCSCLPKLEELTHLKRLELKNIGVEYIIEENGSGNPVKIQFPALEELILSNIPNLKGLSKEQLSNEAFPKVKSLWIPHCTSLRLQQLPFLQKLEYLNCSSSTLALLSEQDIPRALCVYIEESLTCFPMEMLVQYPKLRSLIISDAKEISVTRGGLEALKVLTFLRLLNFDTMTCIPQGMLRNLSALQTLSIISCREIVELPEEIKHLHNLQNIHLSRLPKMVCLRKPLQHLPTLEYLYLSELPELNSLPDQLPSLHRLKVTACPKVVSVPALPNAKELRIIACPQLERRCHRGTGEDWHKISHIRRLRIHYS
ncbi:disease resistance protein RGA2-like isoform X2 [Salvia hispanica]|uniref:disease resistance protein RGA2-like isoform X2 n=1 Tax=Salvia hispanica TaxID=49212 RepID=UPI002009CEC2|nr:disease resistance protein RGA2-like isoform X2 [Salvia hispanica]